MDLRRNTVSLGAALLLGMGATALAAEIAQVGAQTTSEKTAYTPVMDEPRNIDDVDAVPFLKAEGKESYKKWLSAPYNRAFAINPKDGSWGLYPDESEREYFVRFSNEMSRVRVALMFAIQDALERCQKKPGDKCFLYAQNGDVVWDGSIR